VCHQYLAQRWDIFHIFHDQTHKSWIHGTLRKLVILTKIQKPGHRLSLPKLQILSTMIMTLAAAVLLAYLTVFATASTATSVDPKATSIVPRTTNYLCLVFQECRQK
jgi:hypothetical protein